MKILRITVAPLLIVSLTVFLGYRYIAAGPPGYCTTQNRVYSNEEILEKFVLKGLIEQGMIRLENPETTAKLYLKNHPCCCSVDRSGGGLYGGLLNHRFFGREVFEVNVVYEMSDKAKQNHHGTKGSTHYKGVHYITSCGKTLDVYGIEAGSTSPAVVLGFGCRDK